MIHPFFGPSIYYSINSVFWTIGIEVHFYAVYPAYLVLRRATSPALAPLVLLAVAIAIYGVVPRLAPAAEFIAKHTFIVLWWQWGLGALLADLYVTRRLEMFTLIGRRAMPMWLVGSLVLAWMDLAVFGLHIRNWILPPGCAMIVACLVTRGGAPRVRWLERIGHASYSLYLTHPVAMAGIIGLARRTGYSNFFALFVTEFAAAILFGALFFYVVERHFVNVRPLPSFPPAVRAPAA